MARIKYYDSSTSQWIYADLVPDAPVDPSLSKVGHAADAAVVGAELPKRKVVKSKEPPTDTSVLWVDLDDDSNQPQIIIDSSVSLPGQAAEAKAVRDLMVNKPRLDQNGIDGQLLRTHGDGTTEWVDNGLPTDEQTSVAVNKWLDEHPEATTTVQNGSLTRNKFSSELDDLIFGNYVTPEMFYTGSGDYSEALQLAINSGKNVFIGTKYYICNVDIELPDGCCLIGSGSSYSNGAIEFNNGHGFILHGNNITIKNLHIRGNDSGTAFKTYNLTEPICSKIIIDNVWCMHFEIGFEGALFLSEFNMVFMYYTKIAFQINRGTSVKLIGCYAAFCDYGFTIGSAYSSLINCACDNAKNCAYRTTSNACNVTMTGIGAESIERALLIIDGSRGVNVNGVDYFINASSYDPTYEDYVIIIKNAKYTTINGVIDRRITEMTNPRLIKIQEGLNNVISNSNIIIPGNIINFSETRAVQNRAIFYLPKFSYSEDNIDGDYVVEVSSCDYIKNILATVPTFSGDGKLIVRIVDLYGNIEQTVGVNRQELIHINGISEMIIEPIKNGSNLFDTCSLWTRIHDCHSVIRFKDLIIKPMILDNNSRPYFEISNSKVIFDGCDFTEMSGDGKQSLNMIKVRNCSTIIFKNCILPDKDKLILLQDNTNIVLGLV